MKNFLSFLAAILNIHSSDFAKFTNNWIKLANGTGALDYPWFNTVATSTPGGNINNVASLAYNPSTEKLLVSSRNSNIYIINIATATQEGTLSLAGLGTEAFKFNKIRVDADGVIYGISLAAVSAFLVKIYRWASQTYPTVLCATFNCSERVGDSFGLSVIGTNTVLYASGAGSNANA